MNQRNPYAPPGGYPGQNHPHHSARLEGDVLVVAKDSYLPDVCLKCAARDGIVRRQAKFQWTPVWARLSIIFCTIGGLIVMLLTTKKGGLSVPLCQPCNARWGQAVTALIVSVVFLVAGLLTFRFFDEPAIGGIVFVVVLGGFIGVMLGFVRPRMLQVDKIDDQFIYLKGFHASAGREVTGG
jgi:hypothetical protein